MTKFFDEDGVQIDKIFDDKQQEVDLDKQIDDLQAGSDANKTKKETIVEMRKILGIDETADIKETIKALKEGENVDWKAAREKIGRLEVLTGKLRKEGKDVDDEGNIIENKQSMTEEQVKETAKKVANDTLLDNRKNELLSKYNEEDRKVIDATFNKLSQGEKLTLANINGIMESAERASNVVPKEGDGRISIDGDAPRMQAEGKGDFTETPEGKDFAGKLGINLEEKGDQNNGGNNNG